MPWAATGWASAGAWRPPRRWRPLPLHPGGRRAGGRGGGRQRAARRDAAGALVYTVDFGGLANLQQGRLPPYARVDLRITQRPGGAAGRWSWYIEVINLLNRDNPVELETGLQHNPAGSMPRIVTHPTAGFPLIPSFGVRVRF